MTYDVDAFLPLPVDRDALVTALAVFGHLDNGARTGEWDPFLSTLSDDITWFAPVDGFQGFHRGKESIRPLFSHHGEATRTTWKLENVVANGNEIAMEARTEGTIEGKAYANNLLMLLVVEGGKVVQMREYAGFINGVGDYSGVGGIESGRDVFAYKSSD